MVERHDSPTVLKLDQLRRAARRLVRTAVRRGREAIWPGAPRAEQVEAQFDANSQLLTCSGVLDQLEAVLTEPEWLTSIDEGPELGPPPVWLTYRRSPVYPMCYALVRWDRRLLPIEGRVACSEYDLVESWRELKLLPDAQKQTITVLASSELVLAECEWSNNEQLLRILRAARDRPATMGTLAQQYYAIGARSYLPWWEGTRLDG